MSFFSLNHTKKVLNQVNEWSKGIRYKPGWRWDWEVHDNGFLALRTCARVVDADNHQLMTEVHGINILSVEHIKAMRFEDFIKWFGARLCDTEMHEWKEFYRVNGKCVNDPHPEQGGP